MTKGDDHNVIITPNYLLNNEGCENIRSSIRLFMQKVNEMTKLTVLRNFIPAKRGVTNPNSFIRNSGDLNTRKHFTPKEDLRFK